MEMIKGDNCSINKRYLDIDGISEYTTLSKSTIYKKVIENSIPFLKIGKRTVFDIEQINTWMHNGGTMSVNLPNISKLK